MADSTNRLIEEIKQLRESMKALTSQMINQDRTVQHLRREVDKLKHGGSSSGSSSDSETNEADSSQPYSINITVKIPDGIHPNQTMCIKGFVPLNAMQFSIGLKNVESGNIMLHVNPRYNVGMAADQAASRTDFREGFGWGPEEKNGGNPFLVGHPFKLEVQCTQECFMLRVNNNFWCSFAHRQPYTLIDQIRLKGQMHLSNYSLK